MSELLTLAAAKASRELAHVSGVCSGSDQFLSYLNQATRKIMNRGSFWGTVQKVQVCTYNNCVTWPRYVGTVLATNVNGRNSTPKNNWWDFLPVDRSDFGMNGAFPWMNGNFPKSPIVDNGTSSVFNPIACGNPVYIRVYPGTREDIGKTTTIYGIDSNGLVIRTRDVNGIWNEGVTITIALPFSQTPMAIREVTRITKDVTSGVTRYYQLDPTTNMNYDLVWYDPNETSPIYRTSRLPMRAVPITSIQALIKLEFIPAVADSDLVLISNLDALADMIDSVREKNAGNIQEAQALEASSVRELNLELRNKFPNASITTNVNYGALRMPRSIV